MAQYDPTWSYGNSKLFQTSGNTVGNGDDEWSYGQDVLYHEFTAAAGLGMPIVMHHRRMMQ